MIAALPARWLLTVVFAAAGLGAAAEPSACREGLGSAS